MRARSPTSSSPLEGLGLRLRRAGAGDVVRVPCRVCVRGLRLLRLGRRDLGLRVVSGVLDCWWIAEEGRGVGVVGWKGIGRLEIVAEW